MKKIAVIGANKPLEPFYEKIYGKYEIIGIAWAEGATCKKFCDRFYPVSFTEKDEVLRICREENIDGITSFSLESALPTVVYVSQKMGLTSNTEECVSRTKDKYSQREAFRKAGVPSPEYFKVDEDTDLKIFYPKYPVIVKPIDGGGSQGINMANNESELADAIAKSRSCSRTGRAIVEQFVEGREFSVEYLSYRGCHYNVQITDKVTTERPHFVEMQHHQPANISFALSQKIRNVVESALTALKIENSSSHTELKIDEKGDLYIIEIGARMGGDHITSDLVKLSTGYDFVKAVVELSTGNFIKPGILEPKFSGVYFYNKQAPEVGRFIKNAEKYPEITESNLYTDDISAEVISNSVRSGYFIYQSEKKFEI